MDSNSDMNPSGLDASELAVEFSIRKLDARRPDVLRELAEAMSLEDTGKRVRPTGLHASFTTPEIEVQICEDKVHELKTEVEQAYVSRDQNQVYVLSNRIEHIKGRLGRLVKNYPGNDIACGKLSALCDTLLARLGEAMAPLVQDPVTFDSESRRSTLPLAPPHNMSVPLVHQGAIPKTTRPKAKKIAGRRPHVDDHFLMKQTQSTASLFNTQRTPPQQKNYEFPARPSLNAGALPFVSRARNSNTQFLPSDEFAHMYDDLDSEDDSTPVRSPRQVNMHMRPTKHMDAWKVKYDGSSDDMSVDEFIFRVETLAKSTNTSTEHLASGLHFLLSGRAANWYWIHIRKYPCQNWNALKRALTAHFAVEQSDAEIRVLIEARKQLPKESFADFSVAVQQLTVRLRRIVDEEETVEILKRNMNFRLRESLLFHEVNTVECLHSLCRKLEKIWSEQSSRRIEFRRVNEIEQKLDQVELEPDLCKHGYPNQVVQKEVHAIQTQYIICWNCKDMGHTFQDCKSNQRNVFCYGCGAENTYRPDCNHCSKSGNGTRKPGVVGPRQTEVHPRQPETQNRRPNPFRTQ